MRDSLELMRELGIRTSHVVASGGGAKSAFWLQMMADMFASRIQLVNATEGAAYGAAILASVGAGIYDTVEDACAACIRVTGTTDPERSTADIYNRFYPRYRALYPALREEFARIAELVT